VVIEPNIDSYRELKLRLLNGTHTLSCGLAFLAGYDTVKEAMDDELMSSFIAEVMLHEIGPSIPHDMSETAVKEFSYKVLDRFRNPHIKHHWINITMQYSSKMKMRNIPVLLQYYKTHQSPPPLFSLGFAAYIYFTRPVKKEGNQYYGEWNGNIYPIADDQADGFMKRWETLSVPELVQEVLSDTDLWDTDLTALPGFYESVVNDLNLIAEQGAKAALEAVQLKSKHVA
jgi:tagaturonate reductase